MDVADVAVRDDISCRVIQRLIENIESVVNSENDVVIVF